MPALPRRFPWRAVLLGALAGLLIPAIASAQSLRESTSLRLVPDSVSMYSMSLRNRELFERFVNSRAFARIKGLPLVQMGLDQLRMQWETNEDLAELRELLEDPANKQLIQVLLDGLSHEVFVYGDERVGEWIALMTQLSQKLNVAQMRASQSGADDDEQMGRAVVEVIEKNPGMLRVPGTVIGMKLSDPAAAVAQIARLEKFASEAIEARRPDLKERLRRQEIGGASYLTIHVDGTLVPWDDVLREADLDDQARDRLKAQLERVTFTASIGVRDNYLIISVGEDDMQLRALGQGALLADHPKMQPLARYFDRKVTSIGYASEELMRQVTTANQQMDQMVEMLRTAAPAIPLDDEIKQELIQDAERLAAELQSLQPKAGAMSGITYEVDGGFETVGFNWSERSTLDGSKPLDVLENIGGDPIAFYATRRKSNPAEGEFLRRWGSKLVEYFERIAVPAMEQEQKDLYQRVKDRMTPLVKRLQTANREQLKPALADGQTAHVLAAPLKQPRWHAMMPPADEPLPLPAWVVVTGVSDAEKLRAGASEYFDVLQAMITVANEIAPDKVPPVQLPRPKAETTDHGTIYSYQFGQMIGLDPQIAPNAGLSSSRLAVSLVPSATREVLEAQTPALAEPLNEVRERPLVSAWQVHCHRFVQMVRPWVNYGLQLADQNGDLDPMIPEHVTAVMEVLECIRTSSGYSQIEGDALMSVSRSLFQDLPASE